MTDDTDAINKAIADGSRCGQGRPDADSSTVSPGVVYFPAGTYRVTKPIVSYYYTSLIGDALQRPTIRADRSFEGLAVIDENPYVPNGNGRTWYTNQNNFFRSVAHLRIDLTEIPSRKECSGIHHQVAQATGLRHVHFEMPLWTPASPTVCKGIFAENGSGGHMTSLTFRGGAIGMWVGNQQFTVSNVRFERCQRAISQHWAWTWFYHQVEVDMCQVGLEMRAEVKDGRGETAQGVASLTCADWIVKNTLTAFDIVSNKEAPARGSLVLSNIHVANVDCVVARTYRYWDAAPGTGKSTSLVSFRDAGPDSVINWTWQGDGSPTEIGDEPRTGSLTLPRAPNMLDQQGRWRIKHRPECECSVIGISNRKL